MAKKKITISVSMATYNEAVKLGDCLSSVASWVDEIVIVDGGSVDGTLQIAKKYSAIVFTRNNPSMFHINKQRAIDACTSDWILQLDADEVVSTKLKEEIISTINKKDVKEGYQIPRKNYFLGRFLSKGGQFPDYLVRLFQKGKGRLPCKSVHEQIAINGSIGTLTEPILHFTNNTKEEYWAKADTYTTLTAKSMKKKYKKPSIGLFFLYCIKKPIVTFVLMYVRHKGFVDGWQGLQFAFYSGVHFLISYKKFIKIAMT